VSGYVRTPIVAYLLAAVEQPGAVGVKANQAIADLEKIDAEAVKRARTQMAFGFLQRARTIDPAAEAQRPESQAEGETNRSADNANSNDGFSASAADAQGASGAGSAETPPDPAAFAAKSSKTSASRQVGETEVAAAEPLAGASVAEASSSTPFEATQSAAIKVTSPVAANTLLVIGLPLCAALLLVAVFWIILRGIAV
jgi:hypothetical protein